MTPEAVRGVTDGVQWIILFLSIFSVTLLLIILNIARRTSLEVIYNHVLSMLTFILVGLITYTLHSCAFYALAALDILKSPWGNLWSSLLRLHITILVFIGSVLFLILLIVDHDELDEDDEIDLDYDNVMDEESGR